VYRKAAERAVEVTISLEPHMDGRLETIRRCRDAFERLD
jgi:hypothetical protein